MLKKIKKKISLILFTRYLNFNKYLIFSVCFLEQPKFLYLVSYLLKSISKMYFSFEIPNNFLAIIKNFTTFKNLLQLMNNSKDLVKVAVVKIKNLYVINSSLSIKIFFKFFNIKFFMINLKILFMNWLFLLKFLIKL